MTEEFDYVVVGAGSAGCVLANRLSHDPSVRVLLLEAGGWDWHPLLRVPLGIGRIWGHDRFDWGYRTEPDADGRSIEVMRGKVIGGSHSINAMGHVRGNPVDYDRWSASGLHGWGYADLLPYFKKEESWEDGESEFRGGGGPITVRRTQGVDPLYSAYIEAGLCAGHPYTDDYNGAQQHGFGWGQWTIHKGRRHSTSRAYLHPVLGRRNLKVATHAHARKILIERGRAVGVTFSRRGNERTALASREVILCGGTINTPQLLMLSGVGDPNHLKQFGIEVKVPSVGVGLNLQDHYSVELRHERKRPGPLVTRTRVDRLVKDFALAYLAGEGPATDIPSGFMGFLKTDSALAIPDIQLLSRAAPLNAAAWFPGISSPWQDSFACRPILLRPKSQGHIRLRSSDPMDSVIIYPNFLSHPNDVATLTNGIKLLRDVAAQTPLAGFRGVEKLPGAHVRSDKDIGAFIRSRPATAHHPCGTCRMGTDTEAVLDGSLRVRGVDGLRVADASAMPDLVGGNINATVIAIAEKAADLIFSGSAHDSRTVEITRAQGRAGNTA